MKDPKYVIEAESFEEIAAKLVYLMKLHNEELAQKAKASKQEGPPPKIDSMKLVMADKSRVSITLSRKPGDATNCRKGIRIDGYTLG